VVGRIGPLGRWAWLAVAACVGWPGFARAQQLWRADGPPLAARLLAADAEEVVFETEGAGLVAVGWDDLVRWGAPREPADLAASEPRGSVAAGRAAEWLLAEGGVLLADPTGMDEEQFVASSAALQTVRLPRVALRGLLLPRLLTAAERQALTSWALEARDADRLRLENGDEPEGQVTAIDERRLDLATGAESVELPLERVTAVSFGRSSGEEAQGTAWVGLVDGTRLPVVSLRVEHEQAHLKLPWGDTWQALREQIVFLQPRGRRVAYLSDLSPESYRQAPFLGPAWPEYGRDRSVVGGPLRSRSQLHLKGLGVHSAAQLTYRLEPPAARFEAEASIDRAAGGRGSAVFRVFTDGGDGRWRERYASPIVRGGEPSLPISVDLNGAKRLRLVVDFADRGDERDYADWLEARLVRPAD
jgi:hypothetical protein